MSENQVTRRPTDGVISLFQAFIKELVENCLLDSELFI